MRIILADDYAQPREEAASVLENIVDNSTITQFDNAHDALKFFHANGTDLLVTDIVMPGMNGIELAREVLAEGVIPILLHTGSWAKDYLYTTVFNGAVKKNPIEIVSKRCFFRTDDEYLTDFRESLETVMAKAAGMQTAHLESIDKAIAKINEKRLSDKIIHYIEIVYKELVSDLNAAVNSSSLPDNVKQRILDTKWGFEYDSTPEFMHNLRYPLPAVGLALRKYEEEARDVAAIVQKMYKIMEMINNSTRRYSLAIPDIVGHSRQLEEQPRVKLHEPALPPKLEARAAMLRDARFPYTSIAPGEDVEKYTDKIIAITESTGTGIARSAHLFEDLLPIAGYCDSIPFKTFEEARAAVQKIREMDSENLAKLCMCRGIEQMSQDNMHIIVEPFFDTKYLGAVIRHPNNESQFIIEFWERAKKGFELFHAFMVFDRISGGILRNNIAGISPGVDFDNLARRLFNLYIENSARLDQKRFDTKKYSFQMEFGFNQAELPEQEDCYQMRKFFPMYSPLDFEVRTPLNPIYCEGVFGATYATDMVVSKTLNAMELSLLSRRAEEDGLKVCYVMELNDNPSLPSFITNLGLVVLGSDLAVQGHGYFNAMSQADNVLLLRRASFDKVISELETGSTIRYVSNGLSASIEKIDRTDKLKYGIREELNRK